jgi:hypothetical protein
MNLRLNIELAKSKLEKEKQVIEDTYYQGFSDRAKDIYGKDYYNEKFNNNEN